ncbi:50S ribosomal protein L25 [Fusibacter ferrireducens]|uniref:Large ribosomal subunit protein bL25 n=1 Tax=Fusibacter ferrireducens TaxID=2785058 RepID=A0ABR9ZV61_9FIRM|nr:50S ribosomal protein L25 [Fusibacter ferrireducens]MBF4694325.1 50S ribosomal protein L25 [Fusibacter ferrireducens]
MKVILREESNKEVKKQGMVAGVIYGNGIEPSKIKVDRKDFHKTYEKMGQSAVFACEFAGETHKVYIKDLQREILTPEKIMHFDLLRVSANDKIHAKIQIHIIGKELLEGKGYVVQQMTHEIDCKYPIDETPSDIEYDLSKASVGDTILLSDLEIPSYLEVQNDHDGDVHDQVIVSVSHPKVKLEVEDDSSSEPTQFVAEKE